MRSALYTGTVMHARKTPKENVFRYRVCFYLLDLDELPELDRRVRLFGWNRRAWSASTTATTWTCAPTWPSTGSRPTGSCS